MKQFDLAPGIPGIDAPIPSDTVNAAVVAASTAEDMNVPTGARIVRFTTTAAFWIKPDGTAAVPAADITDGTSSILVPAGVPVTRSCEGITKFSVISATASAIIVAEYWGTSR